MVTCQAWLAIKATRTTLNPSPHLHSFLQDTSTQPTLWLPVLSLERVQLRHSQSERPHSMRIDAHSPRYHDRETSMRQRHSALTSLHQHGHHTLLLYQPG